MSPTIVLREPGASRPAAGPCDVQDVCNGSGPDCPPDAVAGSGTVCRGAAGVCDLT